MILGITGPTGAGKTTLLQVFEDLGGRILDCDAIYHRLLQEDRSLLAAIEARFPGVVEDGLLLRKKLGAIVFSDPQALSDLNAITHAAVKNEVLRLLEDNSDLFAIDAIGLHDGELAALCDITVAVIAPVELRVQRLMAREGIGEDYARSRIAAQRSCEEFSQMCDYTLVNDGEMASFHRKCIAFFRQIGIIK